MSRSSTTARWTRPQRCIELARPLRNEIRLGRGVTYPDGTTEVVDLGVFGIQDTEVDDAPDGLRIRVAGLDRSARFVAARFESPYQITAGTNYVTAIDTVLQSAWPDVRPTSRARRRSTPSLIAEEGSDRWAFAQSMAQAIGMTLYFDGDGVAVCVPDLLSDPALRWPREPTECCSRPVGAGLASAHSIALSRPARTRARLPRREAWRPTTTR